MLVGTFSKHPAKYYFYYLECMSFLQIYRGFSISLHGNTGASFNKHDAMLPLGSSDSCYCRLRDFILLINMLSYFFILLTRWHFDFKSLEKGLWSCILQIFWSGIWRQRWPQHSSSAFSVFANPSPLSSISSQNLEKSHFHEGWSLWLSGR